MKTNEIRFIIENKLKPYGIVIADDGQTEAIFLDLKNIKRLEKVLLKLKKEKLD